MLVRNQFSHSLFIPHTRRIRLRDTLPHLEQAVHVGLETGDLEWAGYGSVRAVPPVGLLCRSCLPSRLPSQFYYCDHLFHSGEPLETVRASQEGYFQALAGRHQELQATYLNIWRRMVLKLAQGEAEESYLFWLNLRFFA